VPVYCGTPGEDEFVKIGCFPEVSPKAFCTIDMRIGANLAAHVTFADFRPHGGRAFANARARKLRETVCAFAASGC
jgi:hypothetical protein